MTEDKATPANGSILVVGGGISGLTTTLEAAEVGDRPRQCCRLRHDTLFLML